MKQLIVPGFPSSPTVADNGGWPRFGGPVWGRVLKVLLRLAMAGRDRNLFIRGYMGGTARLKGLGQNQAECKMKITTDWATDFSPEGNTRLAAETFPRSEAAQKAAFSVP